MKKSFQTRLADFDEENPETEGLVVISNGFLSKPPRFPSEKRPPPKLWRKILNEGEIWGVFEVDDTVLFVQIIDGRVHAHGREAVCKYCGGTLVIRGSQIFCGGECGVYQGNFSYDLNAYLKWDGAKSLTLRKAVAEEEGFLLEERDHEPIHYAPPWSVFQEFEDFEEEE